jgi:regulator of nucleoside diphosphate kinase
MPNVHAWAARPDIHLLAAEADLIGDLALAIERSEPELARLLLEEVDRAELHNAATLPADAVRIGSKVRFRDGDSGREREVRIVLPYQADIAEGAVSVLTCIGAGLIGMRAGQSIRWPDTEGRERRLDVAEVRPPA